MSLGDEYKGKIGLPRLTKDNFLTWIEHVGDLIAALDHADAMTIWDDYTWVVDPLNVQPDPIDRDWQDRSNTALKKLCFEHNKAYKKIRDSLDESTFLSTHQLPRSVPKLLRHLKSRWNNNSTEDRNGVRKWFLQMKLDQYSDMEQYVTMFKSQVHLLRDLKIGMVDSDKDVLFYFDESLPKAWDNIKVIVASQKMTFEQATNFYVSQAKMNDSLPGSVKPAKRGSQAVHYGNSVTPSSEVCRQFSNGHCPRGSDCKFRHVALPGGNGGGSHKGAERHGQAKKPFQGECKFCHKKGHKEVDCYKKQREAKGGSSHKTDEVNVFVKADGVNATQSTTSSDDGPATFIDGFAYTMVADVPEVTLAMRNAVKNLNANTEKGFLMMVLDGASTIGVVQDESICHDVQDCDIYVKVGGNDKPHMVHCKRIGKLRTDTTTDGRRVQTELPVRIIPGFGVNIYPECHFLKRPGYSVNKTGSQVAVTTGDGKVVMRGEALKYDSSWLFYVKVGINAKKSTCNVVQAKVPVTTSLPPLLPSPPTVLGVIPVTYVSSDAGG